MAVSPEDQARYQEHWHLDRRIPVAIVFAILVQTAGAVWWGANLSSRVTQVEKEQLSQRIVIDAIRDAQGVRGERIAALEAGQKAIISALTRIENKIDLVAKERQ